MPMTFTDLHTYQCGNCRTVATTPSIHPYGNPLRCNLCRSFMKRLYSIPIDTPEQQALAQRGVVYNPGITHGPRRCENGTCRKAVGIKGIELSGVGLFCSAKCADEGVKRHEAAMAQPPAHLFTNASGE